MVAIRISRQSGEVLADAGASVAATRVDVEVAGKATEASTAALVRISRQSGEVLGKRPPEIALTRADVEVGGLATQANASARVLISRQSGEVLSSITARPSLTRVDVEVGGLATQANAAAVLRISRQSGEGLARRGSAGPVVPLALSGDDDELFLHDWADEVTLRSAYLTDISISPSTGAESRRGLRLKPERSMDLVWRQTRDEFDAADLSRLDRLYVLLRRLTDRRFQVPLYPDQRELTQSYLSTDSTVFLDTSRGRWFVGARVAIVQLTISGSYSSHTFHLISDMEDDRLVLTTTLGVAVPAGSLILPVIDCEVALEVDTRQEQGCLAEVTLTVDEVPGASQLPPTKADTPTGGQTHLGVPILDVEPDWSEPVKGGRSRQGLEFRSGRARGVSRYAARSRQRHELPFSEERPRYWRLVEHFDTRRGRLRTFWHVDQEHLWRVEALDPTFISITQFGDLADVQEELEGGQVGLVMEDGTYYVRDAVTVQQVATVYRITVDPVLPAGLDPARVARVARARRVRYDSDEMVETWTHAGLAKTTLKIIEALEEGTVDT